MKLLFALLLLSVPGRAAWDLNDVTYLMPLPVSEKDGGLLRVETRGSKGPLLQKEFFAEIPTLILAYDRERAMNLLRVLAVRVDPCFPLPVPQTCEKQIRLIWQPVMEGFSGEVESVDAALHSFYKLKEDEFSALMKDLQEWKKRYSAETHQQPLQVHPAWHHEGTSSPALAEFNRIVLRYAGVQNLNKVTAMLLRRGGIEWTFVAYVVNKGRLVPVAIPRIENRKAQTFTNFSQPKDYYDRGRMAPSPTGADTVNFLVADSRDYGVQDEERILAEARSAFRIADPSQFNPNNMDCVSCHVATGATEWVLRHRPHLRADQVWSQDIYRNTKYDLSNTSPEARNTHNLRGLGYFGKNTAISQRVINESAEVADALSALEKNSR